MRGMPALRFFGMSYNTTDEPLKENVLSRCQIRELKERSYKGYYGVATISRLLKIICLFCRISSLLSGSFAKETYDFREPTNRSHPIPRGMNRST